MLKLTLGLALLNWDESVDRFWAPFIKKKSVNGICTELTEQIPFLQAHHYL